MQGFCAGFKYGSPTSGVLRHLVGHAGEHWPGTRLATASEQAQAHFRAGSSSDKDGSTSRKAAVRTSNAITHTDTCVKVAARSARHLTNTVARRLQCVTADSWCCRTEGWRITVSAGDATSSSRRSRIEEEEDQEERR